MAESEGLRRDGAWEHGVLQQRAAGEAPLHEPPRVCLLILLAPAQANTRGRQQRPVRALASTAVQVREMHAARAIYNMYIFVKCICTLLFYLNIFIYTRALLILYSYFSGFSFVCVPAFWPGRVCGGK